MMIKQWIKKYFIVTVISLMVIGIAGFILWARAQYVVPILMYHHVGDPSINPLILNDVSVASFDNQMRFLKEHDYQVISTDDLVEGIQKGIVFNRKAVVIQFDDGYENNYTNAFPVLKKYGFPAMVFLVSDAMGTLGFLTWDQMKEMEASRFSAGAHSRHHQYLPSLNKEEQWDEIAGSKQVIEKKLGHTIDYFTYPTGGFNENSKRIAKHVGYKAAFTTNRGMDKLNRDCYELKRIRIKDTDKGFVLWAKLSGYYNLTRRSKSGD